MGAYIKNFKMPPPGKYRACVIVDEFGAQLTVDVATSYADHDLRVDPIFPVPTHGRLGDLDALKERATKRLYASNHGSMAEAYYAALIDLIDTAPTIIPAEEGEEI